MRRPFTFISVGKGCRSHYLINQFKKKKFRPKIYSSPSSRLFPSITSLYNVPNVLAGVTEFAAGNTSAETVVADGDGVVLELVREIVASLGHGTDEDAHALLGTERLDIVVHTHDGGVETERNLAAVGREVV